MQQEVVGGGLGDLAGRPGAHAHAPCTTSTAANGKHTHKVINCISSSSSSSHSPHSVPHGIIPGWLTSADEGCTHQGSWGWVGDVAGTAMSKTRVAVQSQGPGNTHREGTYLQLGSPAICVCVWLCACICYNHRPHRQNHRNRHNMNDQNTVVPVTTYH